MAHPSSNSSGTDPSVSKSFTETPSKPFTVDITVYDEWGDHVWAQAKYLVHGYDDVLWTDSLESAINYLRHELERAENE